MWVFQEARLAGASSTFAASAPSHAPSAAREFSRVEGERDDICALGQTAAAHELCKGVKPYMHRHHRQAGVGHYGVFSARRREEQVHPSVRHMNLSSA